MSEVATTSNGALLSFIERAAKDPDFDVAKFAELLRLQREVQHDQARRAFNASMSAAQSEMMPVIRTAQNKGLGNKYAKLEDIDREMRPIITKHGFSVRFGSAPSPREGDIRITCTVAHDAGYFEENHLDSPVSVLGSQGGRMSITPVQAVGSVVTYLRRYLLSMTFNVVLADDDDDGEGSRPAAAASVQRPPRRAAPVAPADPLDLPLGHEWLIALAKALGAAGSADEVTAIGGHSSVNDALARADTPPHVRRQITEMLADAYAKHAEAEPEADVDAAAEPELPEVEIEGERHAAG